MKYGPVLKRKWAVEEWLRNIYAECFWKEIAVKRKKVLHDNIRLTYVQIQFIIKSK
jgi:hypothetical protein